MDEKTIQRIKKLQALAERGVGGEKTTAQKKLAKLLKDNGINSLDELQKEEYEYTIFSYNGTVVLCDYVASYSAALAKDTIFAFLFNFKDYVLNTNYSMGVKKYEDNDTDDQITKGIMLVDGKVVDKNSLVVVKKIEAV